MFFQAKDFPDRWVKVIADYSLLMSCVLMVGLGSRWPSAAHAADGAPPIQSSPMPNIPPDSDATGLGCSFFTRPSIERSNSLGVPSVQLNSYADNAVVCHGANRYQCIKRRWQRIGSDCANSDRKQSWRIEGTTDPASPLPGQPTSSGAGGEGPDPPEGGRGGSTGGPDQGGASGPPGPFESDTPFGGGSGMPSPFNAPFGTNPSQSGTGAVGQGAPRSGAAQGRDDLVVSRECMQQQSSSAREWQKQCEDVETAQGMCATYRNLAQCMQSGIRRARALPCPREMMDSSIAAMQDVIDQAQANARKVCENY